MSEELRAVLFRQKANESKDEYNKRIQEDLKRIRDIFREELKRLEENEAEFFDRINKQFEKILKTLEEAIARVNGRLDQARTALKKAQKELDELIIQCKEHIEETAKVVDKAIEENKDALTPEEIALVKERSAQIRKMKQQLASAPPETKGAILAAEVKDIEVVSTILGGAKDRLGEKLKAGLAALERDKKEYSVLIKTREEDKQKGVEIDNRLKEFEDKKAHGEIVDETEHEMLKQQKEGSKSLSDRRDEVLKKLEETIRKREEEVEQLNVQIKKLENSIKELATKKTEAEDDKNKAEVKVDEVETLQTEVKELQEKVAKLIESKDEHEFLQSMVKESSDETLTEIDIEGFEKELKEKEVDEVDLKSVPNLLKPNGL